MEGYWNFETGSGFGKVFMEMCGASGEGWVEVVVGFRYRVSGELEV